MTADGRSKRGYFVLGVCILCSAIVLLLLVAPSIDRFLSEEQDRLGNMVVDKDGLIHGVEDKEIVDEATYNTQKDRVETLRTTSLLVWLVIIACAGIGLAGAVIGSGWAPRPSHELEARLDSALGDENDDDEKDRPKKEK